MNKSNRKIEKLPQNFSEEEKQLAINGIKSWNELVLLKDNELFSLTRSSLSTSRNLIMLRGMAVLICALDLSPHEAALLMHSGIASIRALAESTPQEVINKTSKFERRLNTYRLPIININKVAYWIDSAKRYQMDQ